MLEQIAALLELKSENRFRVRAFRTAARAVARLSGDLRDGLEDGALARARGIGPATLQIVSEIVRTGRAALLEELREQIPPDWSRCSRSRDSASRRSGRSTRRPRHRLAPGARGGRPRRPAGHVAAIRAEDRRNILKGIAFLRQASGLPPAAPRRGRGRGTARRPRADARCLSGSVVAGEVRRRTEIVKDVVIVVVAETSPAEVFRRLSQLPGVHEFAGQDERRVTLRFAGGGERADRGDDGGERRRRAGAGHRQRGASAAARRARGRARASRFNGAALWRGSEFVPTPDERDVLRRAGTRATSRRSSARGRARSKLAARHALPPTARARRISGLPPLPHQRTRTASNTVEELAQACRDAGLQLRRHHRSQPGRVRTPAASSPTISRARLDEIDRRQRAARGHPGAQGRRGRHPAGRPHRLRRLGARHGSTS